MPKARALAHKIRIKILEYIESQGNINANKIYGTLGLEQSITSTNLKVLRLTDLVDNERNSKFIIYHVTNIDNTISAFKAFIELYNKENV